MIGLDNTRTQMEIARLFNEKNPNSPPILQGQLLIQKRSLESLDR